VQERLEARLRIPVITRDIPDPLPGTWTARRLTLTTPSRRSRRLFCWATCLATRAVNVNESALIWAGNTASGGRGAYSEVLAYEGEAARYGLTLFHQN